MANAGTGKTNNGSSSNSGNPAGTPANTKINVENLPKLKTGFEQSFPGSTDINWYEINNAYHAYFTNGNKKTTAVFSKNGEFTYSITDCPAQELPKEVTAYLQSNYKGFSVMNAREVKEPKNSSFIIVIENSNSYISLLYSNGEWEEKANYNK